MNFNVWAANHAQIGQTTLEDVVGIFGHQLRALGHSVIWDRSNKFLIPAEVGENSIRYEGKCVPAGRGYNILIEGFNESIAALIGQYHAQGARFLVLATEEPTEKGFNHGTQREMVMRQRDFHHVAPFIDGILALVPGKHVIDWYSQHAPTAYVELGHAPTLVRPETQREPPYLFGFYGSLSPRRLKLIKKIQKTFETPARRSVVRVVYDFTSQAIRDRAMQEARVIVQLRKFEEMGLVSSSRCNTALCIGRPVVAEAHDLSKPWDEVVTFAQNEDDFLQKLTTASATWRHLHRGQFERFKERFTPEFCVGRALREIGLIEAVRRVA